MNAGVECPLHAPSPPRDAGFMYWNEINLEAWRIHPLTDAGPFRDLYSCGELVSSLLPPQKNEKKREKKGRERGTYYAPPCDTPSPCDQTPCIYPSAPSRLRKAFPPASARWVWIRSLVSGERFLRLRLRCRQCGGLIRYDIRC